MVCLQPSSVIPKSRIQIPGSKSESNRALILAAIFDNISIDNLSDADDTKVLQSALSAAGHMVDIGHAGTAMRFLTAYYASDHRSIHTLTGSPRMMQRPIGILVDALRQAGAKIEYAGIEGFPPLTIHGTKLKGGSLSIRGDVSSQYISALMLTGTTFTDGLQLQLKGKITSRPYIEMTAKLMRIAGINVKTSDEAVFIPPMQLLPAPVHIVIEPDWSSASYYYGIIALSDPGTRIDLVGFRDNSLQGDSRLAGIYQHFGVETTFTSDGISLLRIKNTPKTCTLDLADTPDLAQTIAVTCLGLQVTCHLTGLQTLRIKETDRLQALQNEIEKYGANAVITDASITITPAAAIKSDITIDTYDDHRMAMAFAALAVKSRLFIRNPQVVSKSYPMFWKHMESIGINISEQAG